MISLIVGVLSKDYKMEKVDIDMKYKDCPSWIGLYHEVLITGKQGTIAIVQSRSASNG